LVPARQQSPQPDDDSAAGSTRVSAITANARQTTGHVATITPSNRQTAALNIEDHPARGLTTSPSILGVLSDAVNLKNPAAFGEIHYL